MSEKNIGLWKLLKSPSVYAASQRMVGSRGAYALLMRNHYRVPSNAVVVDCGCGLGHFVDFVDHSCRYFGFDPNKRYIETASARGRGCFVCGTMADFQQEYGRSLNGQVDVFICNGVLHHLTDEQTREILSGAVALLKPGGRFAACEPAWLEIQDPLSVWFMRKDRGQNIRKDYQWTSLFNEYFEHVDSKVVNNLNWIPWIAIMITGMR